MADVYQWRRRIQPGFPNTLLPVGEQDEADPDITSGFGSSRKKVRPKISSYFSHRGPSSHGRSSVWSADRRASFKETISSPYQTWPEGCEPDPDQTMDSIMRTLIAEPYRPLDVKHNSPLLMIFEGFRNLRDENSSLLRKLKYEAETRFESHHELELERQAWQREREQYQAEVRRLELIISKNKEGVAEVVRARQGSLLGREHRRRTTSSANTSRDDSRETVFEFLERTRIEDERKQEAARKAQRVPSRNRPISPSQKMAILSHKFSTTNHYSDFESPPSPQEFTSLSQASMFEMLARRPSFSDTDSSENGSIQHRDADTVGEEAADYSNLNETLLSKNGSIELEAQPTHYFDLRTPSIASRSTEQLGSRTPKVRPESLRLDHARRFSFEYGDENRSAQAKTQYSVNSPLQRSVSVGQFATKRTALSPCDASSTLAADGLVSSPVVVSVLEFPGISKIPSPVFDSSLARPRREDSTSSFLTAIRAPEGGSNHSRTTSRSSNPLDNPRLTSSLQSSGDSANVQGNFRRCGSVHEVSMAVATARAAIPSDSPKPIAELRASYHDNA
ncbi:uncharacterized protein M437DRAFT_38328 [Aureobasidium melanogenum CBS 110374]|uniref:Uncharacterized protein n=2 Tax=Aureobasidium melanogenum TaxID=46634 RepID=A0A074W2Y4_AURM1